MNIVEELLREREMQRLEKELLAHPLFSGVLPVPTKALPTDWYFTKGQNHLIDTWNISCPSLQIKPTLVPDEVGEAFMLWLTWREFGGRSKANHMEKIIVIIGLMLRHKERGNIVAKSM